MSATLWENAPATKAIRLAPVREIMLAQEQRAKWVRCIGYIDALMPLAEVSAADKMTLGLERMTAKVNIIACDNIIAAAERESARQAAKFQQREGWML